MPKKFTNAVKSGAKVRTIKPTPSTYMHVAIKDGKTVAHGEVKHTGKK